MKRKNLSQVENKETPQKLKPSLIEFDEYLFNDTSDLSNFKKPENKVLLNSDIILDSNGDMPNLLKKKRNNDLNNKSKKIVEIDQQTISSDLDADNPIEIKGKLTKVDNTKLSELKSLSNMRLKREFFCKDVVTLAQDLLGKIFVKRVNNTYFRARIVETEAYKGPLDKAAHCYNNLKTDRTKFFWQSAGKLYVYIIYGNSFLINISAKDENSPEAVLIRAIEPLDNLDLLEEIRNVKDKKMKAKDLGNGPGKVGACLQVNKSHNGFDLCIEEDLFLIDGESGYTFEIERSVRINIDYAEEWRFKPWRFFIKHSPYVSKAKIPYEFIDDK